MEQLSKKDWKALLLAAEHADPEAQWELAYYYEHGARSKSGEILTTAARPKALTLYMAAAQKGHVHAQNALSNLLSTGDDPDYHAAIYWGKAAMKQGDASAAFNLGTIYRDMNKPALSYRNYCAALEMGDMSALLQIGLSLLFGYGVVRNIQQAEASFDRILQPEARQSSQRTREDALYWLSVISLMGLSAEKRPVTRTRTMLTVANVDDDHEQANQILNLIGRLNPTARSRTIKRKTKVPT